MGGFKSAFPAALFLLAGLTGLPVYSGGTGGIAVWLGPTGGFLPGYLLGALTAGLIAGKPSVTEKKDTKTIIKISLAILTGMIVLYIPGVIRFSFWATAGGKIPADKTALSYTLATCVIPFIPGDLIKTVIAVPLAIKLRPLLAQYLYKSDDKN